MAVRIRMKPMGRTHRKFYRIVAIDGRRATDGRELEVLGTYDPMVKIANQQVTLKPSRIKYWQSVGAQMTEKVSAIVRRHISRIEAMEQAESVAANKKETTKETVAKADS